MHVVVKCSEQRPLDEIKLQQGHAEHRGHGSIDTGLVAFMETLVRKAQSYSHNTKF